MTTLTERVPDLAGLLDSLPSADRREVEDAYLRVLATTTRKRSRSLHPAVRSHPPEVTAAAVARGLARDKVTRDAMVADSYSTLEVAALLGISAAAVKKRLGKTGLIAFKHKEDWRYPKWQFDGARVRLGTIDVWHVLPDRHDVAGLVRWFTLPSRQLHDRTPIDAIRAGDIDAAVDAASYVGSR